MMPLGLHMLLESGSVLTSSRVWVSAQVAMLWVLLRLSPLQLRARLCLFSPGPQGCRRGSSYVRSSPPFLPSDAPASCRSIKAGNPKAKSGPAWVKPLSNMLPVKVWCDQDFDGGECCAPLLLFCCCNPSTLVWSFDGISLCLRLNLAFWPNFH